jgi:hypothetical protein
VETTTATEAPETIAAMIPGEMHEQLKVIKNRRGGSIGDNLSRFGGPGISREYRKVVQELHDELHPSENTPAMSNTLAD